MTGIAIAVALLVALAVSARRWSRRAALRRALLALPGARKENALAVGSFEDIEVEVAARRCPCGGRYDNKGESSVEHAAKRLRVVRLECKFCEERIRLYFDVTQMFH